MVQYVEDDEFFLGRDMMRRKTYSEFTAQEIDAEVHGIINGCYNRSREMIYAEQGQSWR